uniref:3-dehydroquinate dehydratase n=1 Tax=Candidatus Kentrum sp. UNK TaxID=2126344 RepID=A0A451B5Z9_9GAMM|nr:MAG: 3-dehydroquinate dehydratase [Candidatus Kentron sp. UNK]VFK73708.1 MAG: 3-dehydroquinate dehydratase [Candidatus Kentron sp. UNK]
MAKLLLLHGPNLNLLGEREPEIYGSMGLAEINQRLTAFARERGHELACFQSNAEHELVDSIQAAREQDVRFILINPAAFTHTSVAIRDAFLAVSIPFIEVHLSNIHRREPFRRHSYLSDIAVGVIAGLGPHGYELALRSAMEHLAKLCLKPMSHNPALVKNR